MVIYTSDSWAVDDVDLRLTVRFQDSVTIDAPETTARDLRDQLGAAAQEFAPRVAVVRWIDKQDDTVEQIDIGYVTDEGRTNLDALCRAPDIVVEVLSRGFFASARVERTTVETAVPDFWGGREAVNRIA